MQQKKNRRGREYLNDFRRDVNGSYLYQGSYRRYTGSMPYAKLRGLLWALCGGALAALAAAGIKTAVVSNKPDATTKTLAARFFPGLPAFGQRDDVPPKPAPDLVFRALETLGVDAADAVYVGDSEVDVATARNAGLPLAAVS